MPVVRIQIDRDGDMNSNIHLGEVTEEEFDEIPRKSWRFAIGGSHDLR